MTEHDALLLAYGKLNELAEECAQCNGDGTLTVSATKRGREHSREVPCLDCEDIREVLVKVKPFVQPAIVQ